MRHQPLEITTKTTSTGHTFKLEEQSVQLTMTTNTREGDSAVIIMMTLKNGDEIFINQLENTLSVNGTKIQLKGAK